MKIAFFFLLALAITICACAAFLALISRIADMGLGML